MLPPEEREERRERDAVKYHDVRTAAAKRHFAKIEAEYAADAAKKAAIQAKIDRQHKKGEKAGTTNPHRDQQPELGGIRGVGHGDEGMRRVGVQSLKGKDEYFAKIFDTSVKQLNQGVAARNKKRRDALPEGKATHAGDFVFSTKQAKAAAKQLGAKLLATTVGSDAYEGSEYHLLQNRLCYQILVIFLTLMTKKQKRLCALNSNKETHNAVSKRVAFGCETNDTYIHTIQFK